jgi:hypothetical protein
MEQSARFPGPAIATNGRGDRGRIAGLFSDRAAAEQRQSGDRPDDEEKRSSDASDASAPFLAHVAMTRRLIEEL